MRCKVCSYSLWQLAARTCPECGTPFKPSEYDFVINSVRFCCPQCSQAYYGTGLRGHLFPAEFDCVSCGRRLDMDQMILQPTEGVREVQTTPGRNPWVERRDNSIVGAWARTIGLSIGGPAPLGRYTPPSSSAGRAYVFAYLTALLYFATGAMWVVALPMVFIGGMTTGRGLSMVAAILGMLAGLAALLGIIPLIVHGLLRLTGRTEGGLRGSALAVWYTTGVNLPSAIPCISFHIGWLGWIWWGIAAGFALAEIQKVRLWRAFIATGVPVVLAFLIVVGSFFALVYAGNRVNAAATAAAAATGPAIWNNSAASRAGAQTRATTLASAIRRWAAASTGEEGSGLGRPPRHIGQLLIDDVVQPMDLLNTGSPKFSQQFQTVAIGPLSLQKFLIEPAGRRREAIEAAIADLPENTIAYRLGEIVFTHPGLDLSRVNAFDGSGGLWVFIEWPDWVEDPAVTGPNNSNNIVVYAGLADGSTTTIRIEKIDETVAEQNALRARFGLPPLPDPRDVAEDEPAAADEPPVMIPPRDG